MFAPVGCAAGVAGAAVVELGVVELGVEEPKRASKSAVKSVEDEVAVDGGADVAAGVCNW